VVLRGQLCKRCFEKAKEQSCEWLDQFDGDRFGFRCVILNERMDTPRNVWKRVMIPGRGGEKDTTWEKDPRVHKYTCQRATYRYQLCVPCYDRVSVHDKTLTKYFDDDWVYWLKSIVPRRRERDP
jgi:uncharacterized protein YPO0396